MHGRVTSQVNIPKMEMAAIFSLAGELRFLVA